LATALTAVAATWKRASAEDLTVPVVAVVPVVPVEPIVDFMTSAKLMVEPALRLLF
jgi:hypothetical protein